MFKSISRKLLDRPNCVEELAEMREWMKYIPDIITEHSVTVHCLCAGLRHSLILIQIRRLTWGR